MLTGFATIRKTATSFLEYLNYKLFFNPKNKTKLINEFHNLYYASNVWTETYWQGNKVYKCPLDLWMYQELIYEIKPDVIVETGTARGGSALYLAQILDLINNGRIYTVDIYENPLIKKHPRVKYLIGSSVDQSIFNKIKDLIKKNEKVLIILDSHHSKDHVLAELKLYSTMVTEGSYIIVEDTNINGHPVNKQYGPGPMEAVEEFLKTNENYVIDVAREKFILSFNPKGYLKRIN